MKKQFKKAIADINKAIVENQIDNFAEQFDDSTNTYYFVKECLTENQLDADKMQDFSEEHLREAGITKRYNNDDKIRCIEEIIGEIQHGKL